MNNPNTKQPQIDAPLPPCTLRRGLILITAKLKRTYCHPINAMITPQCKGLLSILMVTSVAVPLTTKGSEQNPGSVNARDVVGSTKLMTAALGGDTNEIKGLIARGADVNLRSKVGADSLMYAALKGNKDIVKMLIAAGAKTNTTNSQGHTALCLAARAGNTEIVKILVAADADVNAQEDTFGESSLVLAAKNGHKDTVKALIAAGADVGAQDNDAKTAIDRAKDNPSIVAVLKAAAPKTSKSMRTRFDGSKLDAQLKEHGIGDKAHINISKADLATVYASPTGFKLTLTTRHRWTGPVTLRGFNSGGSEAYTIGAMVSAQNQSGPVEGALPIAAGTIYRIFGKVQLLGNTITSNGAEPLILMAHSTGSSKVGEADMDITGPLYPVIFEISNAPQKGDAPAKEDVVLTLVHISGKGSATLRDSTSITFK